MQIVSGKNKKNISKYRLLKILPRVLSVKPVLLRELSVGNVQLCDLDIPGEKWLKLIAHSGDPDQMPKSAV